MSNEVGAYQRAYLPDPGFPVRIFQALVRHRGRFLQSHWHEQLELLYFREGRARLTLGSKPPFEVGRGDLVVVNGNETHMGICLQAPLRYRALIFDLSLLRGAKTDTCDLKYLDLLETGRVRFRTRITEEPALESVLRSLTSVATAKAPGYELFVKGDVYRLLGLLFRNHLERVLSPQEETANTRDIQRINAVLRHIERNSHRSIPIDELAQICGISRFHFSHLFKKRTGLSAHEYSIEYRLGKAEQLLLHSDHTMMQIAIATGFTDANYFSRQFRRSRGLSPSEFRRQARETKPPVRADS